MRPPTLSLVHVILTTSLVASLGHCAYAGARGPLKFQGFLPFLSQSTLGHINHGVCNATLHRYEDAWRHASLDAVDKTCVSHQECLLEGMSELAKSYMASSSLVLGFTPLLFSTLGPSISELSLLSLHRPVLTALLAFGTVGLFQTRALQYDDDAVTGILEKQTALPGTVVTWLRDRRHGQWAASAAQYILAALAVANLCWASWDLGLASGLNFVCQSSYMPIVWTTTPIVVSLPAAVALNTQTRRGANKRDMSFLATFRSEGRLCLGQEPVPPGALTRSASLVFWHWVSAVLGFLHLLTGILIYSSLMFTMTTDAAVIVLRYLVSVLVCRLILIFELAGLQQTHDKRAREGDHDASVDTAHTF
ncbi:uncharacterized protein F5Z01DRAFT_676140 [Emericellopsis atlantica]|uniref:Uncharacterized protein n=1 Tax=Emericellopsis atlantica TaxID=2614577 RepID=A0A9P7ZHL4_9HYPO|nr:uncharacterized protein F5Z01DRAFT_676140 [Emericellopsis atlantica]KAG9252259.1 hypothetical protein F5Z01DRAFT_676140 [Emericellopsis atlantica]